MARRTTLSDVARAAGVSIATVDRVVNQRAHVSDKRARQVYQAAQSLGFHGLNALKEALKVAPTRVRLGVALQRPHHFFYKAIEEQIRIAATERHDVDIEISITHLLTQAPTEAADTLRRLAARNHAVAMVTADHSLVTEAAREAKARGVYTFALLSDFAVGVRQAYVGLDNRQAGRTAAWALAHSRQPAGRVAIVVGNHRFLAHEMREIGFRTYFREHASEYEVIDTLVCAETEESVKAVVSELISREKTLAGFYVTCPGMQGAVEALRDADKERRIAFVCNEITPMTRDALASATALMVIASPVKPIARQLVNAMVDTVLSSGLETSKPALVPLEIYISENL